MDVAVSTMPSMAWEKNGRGGIEVEERLSNLKHRQRTMFVPEQTIASSLELRQIVYGYIRLQSKIS